MNISKFLKDANAGWDETVEKAKSSNFTSLADGSYIAQISSAELGESKAGKVQIVWGFTILEGDLAGETHKEYMGLENTRGLEPLAWRLQALGYRLEDVNVSQLEEFLSEVIDRKLIMKMQLKTTNDYQNVRIIKLLPTYEPEEQFTSTAATTAEDEAEADSSGKETADVTDDGDGEEAELSIGMKVSFKKDDKTLEGIVKKVNDDEGTADVRVGVKTHVVAFDDMEILEEGLDG